MAAKVPGLVLQSRQQGTVQGYLSGFRRWRQWASKYKEVNVLPAEPKYVALYLTKLFETSRTHAPVTNAYYAISWAHKTACVLDPTCHDVVKRVKESTCRLLGSGDNKKSPIESDTLFLLCNKFGDANASLKDLRILCICVIAFAGFLRYDEFSSILLSDVVFHTGYVTIFIEKSKTDTHREGKQVFIAETKSDCCPIKILQRYIKCANFSDNLNQFLFRGLTYHRSKKLYTLRKQHKGMCYTSAREVILNAFTAVGLDTKKFGTHSLRKGGATAAAGNQVNDRLIKKHGRWQSENSKDLYISEDVQEKLKVSQNLGI